MLILTKWLSGRRAQNSSATSGQAAAAPNGNSATPAARAQNDQLALTQQSQTRNPFEGVSPGFSKVKVDSWGKGDNSSVLQILINQGYTSKEIYNKGENGKTLLEEVSRVNDLRNPNLIRAGQDLVVPSKQAQEAAATNPEVQTPEEQPATTQPPQTGGNEAPEPAVNTVKIDKWGEGPNSSLGAILKSQGFKHKEIFQEDANGDSLAKQIARANGLSDPNKIQAGKTLQIPNSQEALSQMNIPEMPAQTAPPATQTQPETTQPPVTQTPADETRPPVTQTEETRPPVTQNTEGNTQTGGAGPDSEITANMGMLLNGAKDGKFTRNEFQYLNARASRYTQMRARFSGDGYSNDELQKLGTMEKRYGVEFAKLAASDDINLPAFPATSNDPELQLQVRHYHESGPIYDRYRSGSANSEDSINAMARQRAEARLQETR